MFERIDREADGEVYVNEVLDFLHSMAGDLDQVCSVGILNSSENAYIISFQNEDVSELFREYRSKGDRVLYLPEFMVFWVIHRPPVCCHGALLAGHDGRSEGRGLDEVPVGGGAAHPGEGHEERLQAGGPRQGRHHLRDGTI